MMMSKPVDLGSIKVGQYILIDDEPCRVVEYEKSKPGKHGSAKARIVAMGFFTEQKRNVVSPVDAKIEVPIIDKRTGQIIATMGENVQIMDLESYETFETPLPKDDELRSKLESGIEVEYWKLSGRSKIIRTK
jgi:translation initiation factor 5A